MRNSFLLALVIAVSFSFGFGFKSLLTTHNSQLTPDSYRDGFSPAVVVATLTNDGSRMTSYSRFTSHVLRNLEPGRATGLGGIFFKCKDPKLVREWYATHLGLNTNPYGAVFEFYQGADSTQKGFLQWSPFKETTKYFEPSTKDFMINYRVTNMEALIDQLTKDGITVCDSIQTVEYGKFVHILDQEGNKLELWEPNDVVYEKMGVEMGLKTTK